MSAEIDHAILMSYDAMRICMGQSPVNATVSEVIRWMQVISGEPDRIAELEKERDKALKRLETIVWQKEDWETRYHRDNSRLAARNAELEKDRDEAKAQATAFCEKWVQLEAEVARLREETSEFRRLREMDEWAGVRPSPSNDDAAIRAGWRAAIVLSNNVCVDLSDRLNAEDGNLEAVSMASSCAKRIATFIEPDEEYMRQVRAAMSAEGK